MKPVERYPYYINVAILSLQNFFGIVFTFLGFFLLGRVVEWLLLTSLQANMQDLGSLEFSGVLYDLRFFFQWSVLLLLPFVALGMILNYRVLNFLFILFGSLVIIAYYLMIMYFSTTRVPLGADIFGYNSDEIKQTLGAAGYLKVWFLIPILLFIALCFYVCIRALKINWPVWLVGMYIAAGLLVWLVAANLRPTSVMYGNETSFYIATNKFDFLVSQVQTRRLEKSTAFYDAFYYDDEFVENSTRYISEEYPLLTADPDPDVLSPFFKDLKQKPNIVIIIVEGLGRSYSGPDATFGSFTPYLDSLAKHSLSWNNFLSNGGRTFAVLPAILGSLPNNVKSFMERREAMPNFLSMSNILKQNGYSTRFFHGGEAKFDYMDFFLKKAGVDKIVQRKDFPKQYDLMPSSKQGFTWGYGDFEVFNHYFDFPAKGAAPTLDVFLTLSNHSPFLVHGQEKYNQMFNTLLNKYDITDDARESYRSYQAQYSTVLYSDDAIRMFMDKYKKSPRYQNTIFIITGDHRMPEIPMENSLCRFQVPFILFSPLLERSKNMGGVNSHLDVSPSLLALLKNAGLIQTPAQHAWVGSSFDTSAEFSSRKFIPLMRNKTELVDFVFSDVYCANDWYQLIDEGMNPIGTVEARVQTIASSKFFDYKRKSKIANEQNRLLPDSIYKFIVKK